MAATEKNALVLLSSSSRQPARAGLVLLAVGGFVAAFALFGTKPTTCDPTATWRVVLLARTTAGPWSWRATAANGQHVDGPVHPSPVYAFTPDAAVAEARRALHTHDVPDACVVKG